MPTFTEQLNDVEARLAKVQTELDAVNEQWLKEYETEKANALRERSKALQLQRFELRIERDRICRFK